MSQWQKRDAKRELTGRPWRRLRDRILQRDRFVCQPCKREGRITEAREVDHMVPLAKGGTDDESNLQSICSQCHHVKSIRDHGGTPVQAVGADGWPLNTRNECSTEMIHNEAIGHNARGDGRAI
jgi:5-methylcytosine-specific restriction protein A